MYRVIHLNWLKVWLLHNEALLGRVLKDSQFTDIYAGTMICPRSPTVPILANFVCSHTQARNSRWLWFWSKFQELLNGLLLFEVLRQAKIRKRWITNSDRRTDGQTDEQTYIQAYGNHPVSSGHCLLWSRCLKSIWPSKRTWNYL